MGIPYRRPRKLFKSSIVKQLDSAKNNLNFFLKCLNKYDLMAPLINFKTVETLDIEDFFNFKNPQ